ncbi:hypothetical protein HPB48_014160 [Haemaphysalis longicornis]|uniref:histone acetyltransferase n=1 Tax=Haemaphysalis longicornis TaxID=44386 RepID=A0A9J6FJ20_HAELO|nr:hypothetical protein HPB48_014160 [Haemaphysalis longicornis]
MTIFKNQFVEMKNYPLEHEQFVELLDGGRKLDQLCVLHFNSIWREGFTCNNWLQHEGKKRKRNECTSKRLPTCKFGISIKNRVNYFLKKESAIGEVAIRVVAPTETVMEVKPGMKNSYADGLTQFPYRAKALFLRLRSLMVPKLAFSGCSCRSTAGVPPAQHPPRVHRLPEQRAFLPAFRRLFPLDHFGPALLRLTFGVCRGKHLGVPTE